MSDLNILVGALEARGIDAAAEYLDANENGHGPFYTEPLDMKHVELVDARLKRLALNSIEQSIIKVAEGKFDKNSWVVFAKNSIRKAARQQRKPVSLANSLVFDQSAEELYEELIDQVTLPGLSLPK